jgi:predicted DNA-binding protein (UPF0251 family)
MPYKFKSVLKSFQYSTENYQIISDFLIDGLKSNPDILLKVNEMTSTFRPKSKPLEWFRISTIKDFISALINVKLEAGDNKLENKINLWIKNENIDRNIFDKRINLRVLQKSQNQQLLKLLTEIGMIEIKKGNLKGSKNGKSIQGTWIHQDLLEEYLKWLVSFETVVQPDGLYLIQTGEFTKIGISQDIEKRIKSMKTDNPLEIELLFYKKIKNVRKVESFLHKQLKEYNVKNEWFKLDKKITDRIIKNIYDLQKLENSLGNFKTPKLNLSKRQLEILHLLENDKISTKEIAKKIGFSTSTVLKELKFLIANKQIERIKVGRNVF